MTLEEKTKPDWFDRTTKLLVPIVGGLLVVFAATFGDNAITNYTSRQENARLITELQIQREQAESALRKDVFQQAIGALLSEDELKSNDLSISKRLLKLELLAQNFGGILSITPLFTEFDRDLEQLERNAGDNIDEEVRIISLRKRLRGIARRLSSDQISALAQQGKLFEIKVNLKPGGKEFAETLKNIGNGKGDNENVVDSNNEENLVHSKEYKWPEDEAKRYLGDPSIWGDQYEVELQKEKHRLGVATLNEVNRHVSVTLGELDPQRRAVSVTLEICWKPNAVKVKFECDYKDESVSRTFTLDFFNFPKVDNTRLSNNQRFSIVLERYDPSGDPSGFLEIAAVIFPAEYSSLRDRPSMQESVELLRTVLSTQDSEQKE